MTNDFKRPRGVYMIKGLKKLRKEQYSTAREFSIKRQISLRVIQRAEGGKERIEFDSAERIAKGLGVNANDIIDNERTYRHVLKYIYKFVKQGEQGKVCNSTKAVNKIDTYNSMSL